MNELTNAAAQARRDIVRETQSEYKYHPAYADGQDAFSNGIRREQNPFANVQDNSANAQRACYAWWAGWDDAQVGIINVIGVSSSPCNALSVNRQNLPQATRPQ